MHIQCLALALVATLQNVYKKGQAYLDCTQGGGGGSIAGDHRQRQAVLVLHVRVAWRRAGEVVAPWLRPSPDGSAHEQQAPGLPAGAPSRG